MKARIIFGIILILLGISQLTGIPIGRYIWPLFLIAVGVIILTNRRPRIGKVQQAAESSAQDSVNEVFVFSGVRKRQTGSDFQGGKIVSVFSGTDFDLSQVKTKQKTVELELVAVFGSLRLRVPEGWSVTSEAVGIAGGVDNRATSTGKSTQLRIKGAAIIGGIEIFS